MARTVARRADAFCGRDLDQVETQITYRSGRQEGILRLLAERGAQLDPSALALFAVLCDMHMHMQAAGRTITVKRARRHEAEAVAITPRRLAQLVAGRDDGRVYRRLGLTREPGAVVGALHRLATVLIEQASQFIGPDGRAGTVVEGFHLIDFYRWWRLGSREVLLIGLAPEVQEALEHRTEVTQVPRAIIRALPHRPMAGRLAVHLLSHDPLPGRGYREIGTEALVPVVQPGAYRHPDHYPHQWRRLINALIQQLDDMDPDHRWEYVRPNDSDPWGKVRCTDATPAPTEN